jgi:hypothetical protein
LGLSPPHAAIDSSRRRGRFAVRDGARIDGAVGTGRYVSRSL